MNYCKICGKKLEETGDICRACKDQIRAEALGRKRTRARETDRPRSKEGSREQKSDPEEHEECTVDDGKHKPRHFKSMADYLEYVKKRG